MNSNVAPDGRSVSTTRSEAEESNVLVDLEHIANATGGTLFVVHGDLASIDADYFLLPTDTSGTVERSWQRLWDIGDRISPTYPTDDAQLIQTSRGVMLVPCDVGGSTPQNSVDDMMSRLDDALILLAAWIALGNPDLVKWHENAGQPRRQPRRARPLLAMPLIGTRAGGLGAERGHVIQALIDQLNEFLEDYEDRAEAYDIVLVCRTASDYAAVQHVRRERLQLQPKPAWLQRLVTFAQRGRLAVMFGAGASAPAGVPLWSDLLADIAARFEVPEATTRGLGDLDPADAATLLAEHARQMHGDDGPQLFHDALSDLVGLDQPTLTHALLANMRPSIAITTNYDQGYELAVEAMGSGAAEVLPWDGSSLAEAPLVLKLHGDVDRGLIVLSRDEFVAMHAFRRPLAGVLQNHMLAGHVLVVGSSMSDATLVHAAEEVAGLIRQVAANALEPDGDGAPGGTILMGNPHPARQAILGRSLTVVVASETRIASSVAARRIDITLDLINCLASTDRSFLLDARYVDLLPAEDHQLAAHLRGLSEELGTGSSRTDLQDVVLNFLHSLGTR